MAFFVDWSWVIVAAPLVGFVVVILTGKRQWQGGALWTVGSIGVSFVFSLSLLVHVLLNGAVGGNFAPQEIVWYRWIGSSAAGLEIEFGILIDNLSALMMALVSGLSLLIAVYSLGYMDHEKDKTRYYSQIALFVAGMLGTVAANNFLQLLIFWEIMGLCSYLLIGFWYYKPEAAAAAKKAFLVTRVGDVLLLVGVLATFVLFGTSNILAVSAAAPTVPVRLALILPLLFFAGAIGKSAQFPLHTWLPDAMEGPTTVSALIHAATMVKAGVYLTARIWPFLVNAPGAALFVAFIGGFTAIFAASMALGTFDIKRVLAFSTMSQLGYMFLALGASAYAFSAQLGEAQVGYAGSIFHLMNHAFFKALLFLGAGAVIHALGTNDMRKMGGLQAKMPITALTMLIASISIAGLVPLSGFWSKEPILATAFVAGEANAVAYLMWMLAMLTVFLTAFYMFRLWYMTFRGAPRWETEPHEAPRVMTTPLAILAIFAFGSGLFIFPLGSFSNFIIPLVEGAHAIFASPLDILVATFAIPLSFITYMALALVGAGLALATLVYYWGSIPPDTFTAGRGRAALHTLVERRYYIDDAYDQFGRGIVYGIARLSDWFDRRIIDGVVNGIARVTLWAARGTDFVDRRAVDGVVNSISLRTFRGGWSLRRGQTGDVQTYVAVIVMGAAIVLFLVQIVFPLLGV